MAPRSKRARATAGAAIILAGVALAAAALAATHRQSSGVDEKDQVLIGEGRSLSGGRAQLNGPLQSGVGRRS